MFDEAGVPSAADHARLRGTFAALCAVPSPSGAERAIVDDVLGRLRALGLHPTEDDARTTLGGNAGNVLCRIPAAGGSADDPDVGGRAPWILLCAHLDTVPVAGEIRPELADGVWRDGLGGVLGADNKATVAAVLTIAEVLALRPVDVAVELLLTVQEEPQLRGIGAFDHAVLRSTTGVVVDHPSPMGGIVLGAPGHVRFEAHLTGRAAHAGIAPERGRSAVLAAARAVLALPSGRLEDDSTVNVGVLDGGDGPSVPGRDPVTNVVPAHARIVGEVRAPDGPTLQRTVDVVEAALHDAVHDPAGPVDLDLTLETRFAPYAHAPTAPAVRMAEDALRAVGLPPRPFRDAGGSDANVLNARGIATVNLSGGNEGAHEAGERIADDDLGRTLDLLAAVVRGAGVPR